MKMNELCVLENSKLFFTKHKVKYKRKSRERERKCARIYNNPEKIKLKAHKKERKEKKKQS